MSVFSTFSITNMLLIMPKPVVLYDQSQSTHLINNKNKVAKKV